MHTRVQPLVSKSLPAVGGPTAEPCIGQYLVPELPLPFPATESTSKMLPRGPAPLHHQLSWEQREAGHQLGLQGAIWAQRGGPACIRQAALRASALFGPTPTADPAGHPATFLFPTVVSSGLKLRSGHGSHPCMSNCLAQTP